MEIAIERRNEEAPRVPMGEVTVELSQSDRAESFGAESFGVDGVNLGLGGLSLRASQLPRVGAPFRCRFSFPEDERFVVEAAAEVVWTADRGRHIGEFGLRFTDVGPSSRRMIESMVLKQMTSYGSIHVPLRKPMAQSVAASSRSLSTRTEPQSIPASDQPVVDREASWNSPSPEVVSPGEDVAEETQLFLERVSTPILASVVHRVDDCLIVEQELPFLRIGMGIREGAEGRLGTLQTVELRMERDVPRLLLGVLWDAEQSGEPTSGEQRSGEESSGEQKSGEASSVTTLPQIHDDTVHDTLLPFGLRVAANAQANPIRSLPESRDGRIQPTEERLVDAAPSSSEVPHEFLANLERSRSGEPLDAQRSLTGSSKESSAQTGREVLEDARTAVVQVGNGFLVILQRIQPVLRVLTAVGARLLSGVKQRALFRFIRVQPTFDRMRSMFPSKSLFPGLQMRSRRKQAAMKKRPQTSRAKVRVQGQSRRTEPAPSVSRSRPVILAVLALAGVGSAGYAFWPSKPELPPSAAPDPSYADALSLSSQDTRSAAPPPTTASPAVAASSSA
ncbi:MAG: PilZ domain-containing protein, partial [Myxococcota bacterium]